MVVVVAVVEVVVAAAALAVLVLVVGVMTILHAIITLRANSSMSPGLVYMTRTQYMDPFLRQTTQQS